MNETLTLDPDVLRQTLLNKLSQQTVLLVQQEAAIAQLMDENAALKTECEDLRIKSLEHTIDESAALRAQIPTDEAELES